MNYYKESFGCKSFRCVELGEIIGKIVTYLTDTLKLRIYVRVADTKITKSLYLYMLVFGICEYQNYIFYMDC
jgi:hypothetical protein